MTHSCRDFCIFNSKENNINKLIVWDFEEKYE